ncbi:catalase X [Brevibacillus agri]|uniref:Catalase n=1 Tax=Brevibacillus agri TaxID=51101 RepID=A0A3M8B1M8_9BACL|nr:catalase [Brevibacillus agri]MED4568798.1 catalase [Brevibacillus agri]QAV13938.1 catalase [Brevibacillus agri]RNB56775.1 catalase [Brevibacillus agri]GED26276.1 catalase X [Brevibacillus agri]
MEESKNSTQGRSTEEELLTNRQGHPITDNQNMRTVGNRGPTVLENYDFLEKITHFDRERIPERVVHGRGAGAHGYFEAYGTVGDEPVAKYTRAKLFAERGKKTPVFVRFSTVIHGTHSPETLRDPRGFAVKFYTEDGNWDLVGNNLKVFFIRDAMKFPDLVHAFKPDPVTNIQDVERIFDFISNTPEAMHMITFLFSPWGIPANYRQMQGSGVNTYKWVNQKGEAVLVKYHWQPLAQGIKNLTQKEAEEIQGKNFNHATQDLYEAIERGDYPEWELCVQIMSDDEHPELDFDPLDPTKLWPEEQFPFLPVGKMVLNKNPENYFAEVEQVAFGTGVLVDGLDFSDDKLLQGRTFSYSDTQRYRVGANYLQLPINAPKKHVATNQEGGQMLYRVDRKQPHINYEPSTIGGLHEAKQSAPDHQPEVAGKIVRQKIDRTNDFKQAGERYRLMEDWEKDDLIANLTDALLSCDRRIQEKMLDYFFQCDEEYGSRVKQGIEQGRRNRDNGHGGPMGATNPGAGVRQAEQDGHPAEPY